ncbi:tRNA glutamyl-Q(34) synthetase GluQRS [Asaia spathodeae]|uniref:tRNA glutamyl-Q(34) synthetase GluQRS n=1 Tax=Asaia spathodeae TaxID=657016 RepID=A0ABX2P257_9PROT|nr:tRNA glutamyl-Q(34) synthetase GluQRS [Asaia spathodeae]GBR13352.1 glutamyl-tRNA synthetase [Asaia spathodeae NBRC 105894]
MTGFHTRFAPSPTGFLHLGHVASAFHARERAGTQGKFLIRIEDIDAQRCLPEFEAALLDDLAWLSFVSDGVVLRQSDHLPYYRATLERLRDQGLLYACTCSRAQVKARALGVAPDGSPVYGGRCRGRTQAPGQPHVWRLDMAAALSRLGGSPSWREIGQGAVAGRAASFGDVVLGRRDNGVSYHLCVTCDDARQGITLVTRGADLFEATSVHRVLQELLGFPEPLYAHHGLLLDEAGCKLSKRDGAESLRALRAKGLTAPELIALARKALDLAALIPAGRSADR